MSDDPRSRTQTGSEVVCGLLEQPFQFMAHSIQALIAAHAALDGAGVQCPAALVELPQGLALLAITRELWSWIHGGAGAGKPGFDGVSLKRWDAADHAFLKRLAREATVAYVETDYSGGADQRPIRDLVGR